MQADQEGVLKERVHLLGRGRRLKPLQAREPRPLHVVPVEPLLVVRVWRSGQAGGRRVEGRHFEHERGTNKFQEKKYTLWRRRYIFWMVALASHCLRKFKICSITV
jgi:hypothetical protein